MVERETPVILGFGQEQPRMAAVNKARKERACAGRGQSLCISEPADAPMRASILSMNGDSDFCSSMLRCTAADGIAVAEPGVVEEWVNG